MKGYGEPPQFNTADPCASEPVSYSLTPNLDLANIGNGPVVMAYMIPTENGLEKVTREEWLKWRDAKRRSK